MYSIANGSSLTRGIVDDLGTLGKQLSELGVGHKCIRLELSR
jgi:hypothetical protein